MRWRTTSRLLLVAGVLASAATGCSTVRSYDYSPEELRAEVARRVPGLAPEHVEVPHEVSAEQVERARAALPRVATREQRVEALLNALADPEVFGLHYDWSLTAGAEETLNAGRGNCLSLSTVLVGLARELGFRAYYAEATTADKAVKEVGEVRVWSGHMAAVVHLNGRLAFIDFSGKLPQNARYRRIDDLRALAHFYNNQGYALMHEAQDAGERVPWERVRSLFETATRIEPAFARAWNNLGVATSRLGDTTAAREMFNTALQADPRLQAAQQNLENLEAGFASPGLPDPLRAR